MGQLVKFVAFVVSIRVAGKEVFYCLLAANFPEEKKEIIKVQKAIYDGKTAERRSSIFFCDMLTGK